MRKILLLLLLNLLSMPQSILAADPLPTAPKVNKLLYMYRFFYLPFDLDFQVGRNLETILPYVAKPGSETPRLMEAHELVALDADWAKVRTDWKTKSLLETTQVPVGKSIRISQRLVSHRIPLNRSYSDTLSPSDKASISESLKGKTSDVVGSFYQLRFLKSFLEASDSAKFNFFIFSPSWCESSREYRVLLEAYFKKFINPELVLHSVIIEDPKQKIFDSPLVKELFPHPKQYTHETVPRFLALQTTGDKTQVWEEGDALRELYERYYEKNRGFLKK